MKNVSRDDNNYHLVTQAGNQTDHSVHGQYWITIFKDCNKINLICPEDNLFLNLPIGSPSQVLAHPSNWKQQNVRFFLQNMQYVYTALNLCSFDLYLFSHIKKIALDPTPRICRVTYCCFKEDCWNALAEINIHQKSARKTARHPSLYDCDPPCHRKNPTELISWQPGPCRHLEHVTRGGQNAASKMKAMCFFSAIMKRNCNLRLCIAELFCGGWDEDRLQTGQTGTWREMRSPLQCTAGSQDEEELIMTTLSSV